MTNDTDERLELLAEAAEELGGEFSLDRALEHTVQLAVRVTGARYGALGVVDGTGKTSRFVSAGAPPEIIGGMDGRPSGRGLLGLLIREARAIRLEGLRARPAWPGPDHPEPRAILGTPIRARGQVFGNLYLAEKPGGFTDTDARVVLVLAAQAGSAIQNASLAERLRSLVVRDERDRIFHELHDGVIQSLFSIGVALSSARELIRSDPDRVTARIDESVEGLDDILRGLRNAIFHLRPERAAELGLARGLVEVAREHEVNALDRPELDVEEGLDQRLPEERVDAVLRIARIALGLCAGEGSPGGVALRVCTADDRLDLWLTGEGGVAAFAAPPGLWLERLESLVHDLDGEVEPVEPPGGGTSLRMHFPLSPLQTANTNGYRP